MLKYYGENKLTYVHLEDYLRNLKSKMQKNNTKKSFIISLIKKVLSQYPKNTKLKMAFVHGDFTKEQVLLKNNSYVFVDWCGEKDIFARDLIKFFREEPDLLGNKEFLRLLRLYPKEVQENIQLYILLHEIYFMIRRGAVEKINRVRIKNVLKTKNSV